MSEPNPTSGFIVLVPQADLIKLEMSVADGLKFIVSLGTVAPDYRAQAMASLAFQSPTLPGGAANPVR